MTERDPASANGGAADSTSAEPTITSGMPEEPVAVAPTISASSPGLRSRQGRRNAPVAVRPVRAPISGLRQKFESTAALRESLDAKEAEAQDLRASIEQLRQELDVERTAPAAGSGGMGGGVGVTPRTDAFAEGETTRRRPWWVLMIGAAALALLLLLVASQFGAGTPDDTAATPGVSAQQPPVAPSGAAPSLPAPSGVAPSAAKATKMAWPGGAVLTPPDLPTTGPGLDAPGAHVTFALDDDGRSIDSYEQVRREAPSSAPLYLSVPSLPRTPQPGVANLQVELDGVLTPATPNPDGGWIVTPANNTPFTTAVVRYKLTSATLVSRPGRGDSIVVALSGRAAQAITLHTTDKRVIQLSCQLPGAGEAISPACQQVSGTERSATISSDLRPAVSLTVNLPQ